MILYVHHVSSTINADHHIQITVAPEGHHETLYASKLDVRKIKDSQQSIHCTNDYSFPIRSENFSTIPAFMWEPTHPTPKTVNIAAH
jgi:hypothetical protein